MFWRSVPRSSINTSKSSYFIRCMLVNASSSLSIANGGTIHENALETWSRTRRCRQRRSAPCLTSDVIPNENMNMSYAFPVISQIVWILAHILILLMPSSAVYIAGLAVLLLCLNNITLQFIQSSEEPSEYHIVRAISAIPINYICLGFIFYALYLHYASHY